MTLLRRGAVAALTVACAVALAGCGGSDEPAEDDGAEVTQATEDDAPGKADDTDDAGDAGDTDDAGDAGDAGDTGDTGDAGGPVADAWAISAAAAGSSAGSDEFDFECPAGGTTEARVWGGDDGQYTDDSSICVAAVHAGVITVVDGGTVHVTTTEGLVSYGGSTANGVTSQSWGPWGVSFEVSAG